jgi:hypothetical protein
MRHDMWVGSWCRSAITRSGCNVDMISSPALSDELVPQPDQSLLEQEAERSRLERAAGHYSESAVMQSALMVLASVAALAGTLSGPVVSGAGFALGAVLSGKAQQAVNRRLQVLMHELQAELSVLQNCKVDWSGLQTYVQSEPYLDLMIKAVETTARTRHDEKIRLYARVLSNALLLQDLEDPSPEEYLDVLAELSPRELAVAKALYDQQKEGPTDREGVPSWIWRVGWPQGFEACASLPPTDWPFLLSRLQARGLIREVAEVLPSQPDPRYLITPTFRTLMEYLNHAPNAGNGDSLGRD